MPPDTTALEIPWGMLITIVSVAFTAFGGLVTTLLVKLHSAGKKNTKALVDSVRTDFTNQLATVSAELSNRVGGLGKDLETKSSQLDANMLQLGERVGKYFEAHDRLRDKWEEFLREYLKIDSTRGQKIDALFRVVDQMQVAVKDIPPAMNAKIEEAFTHSLSELKLYVRDRIQEEKKQ